MRLRNKFESNLEKKGSNDCSNGVRHEGGMTLIQAFERNVGTCVLMRRQKAASGNPTRVKDAEAEHRDGQTRSSVEASVMEMERRGLIVQQRGMNQPEREGIRESSKVV